LDTSDIKEYMCSSKFKEAVLGGGAILYYYLHISTMKKTSDIKIGNDFRPSPQLKKLYYIDMFLILCLAVFSWYLPVLFFVSPVTATMITLFVLVPLVPIVILTIYWIPKYYETIIYRLTDKEMVWRRGVWFKNTGIVPYNRITNVDIVQGPISRRFGIASLKIQTAGYSATSAARSEIKIDGMEDFEGVRELIMVFVRGKKPVAVETYDAEDVDGRILKELVKIRRLLEKPSRK
jgi:membrane protein YdbS with pleckstrin-like domain